MRSSLLRAASRAALPARERDKDKAAERARPTRGPASNEASASAAMHSNSELPAGAVGAAFNEPIPAG